MSSMHTCHAEPPLLRRVKSEFEMVGLLNCRGVEGRASEVSVWSPVQPRRICEVGGALCQFLCRLGRSLCRFRATDPNIGVQQELQIVRPTKGLLGFLL